MSGSPSQQQSLWESTIDLDTLNTPLGSSQQCTSTPRIDLSPSRTRSESPSSAAGNRRYPVGPDFPSKRNGIIGFLGIDSARGSRRSSYSSVTAAHESVWPATNERRPGPLDSPVIHVTHDTASTAYDDAMFLGRWQCCECRRGHTVYQFEEGQHLISILNCLCPHRSCRNCTFQGRIKRFAPIYDVEGSALMPIAGDGGQGLYMGIVCRCCGLSWQAEKVEAPKRRRSFRQRLSILPKKVNPMPSLRHARSMIHLGLPRDPQSDDVRPSTSLSTSRSFLNLRSVSDTQAKEPKPEQQAQGVQVRFYGIECTCGNVTDERSVCFVFLDLPKVKSNPVDRHQTRCEVVNSPKPPYLPKLWVKGHGTPTLHLKGGAHPNPLMCNAVLEHASP